MNLEFLKDIGRQLKAIWGEIKTYQKFTVILVVLFLISMLGYQPTSIPSLIVSGLIIWGIYERRISNAEKR